MKYAFLLIASLFLANAAAADDATTGTAANPQPIPGKPGVVLVDGKKFFSLQNAKRFTTAGPSASMVVHHPRTAGSVMGVHHDKPEATGTGTVSTPPPLNPIPPANNDVISVFAPPGTAATPAAPTVSPAAPLNAPAAVR